MTIGVLIVTIPINSSTSWASFAASFWSNKSIAIVYHLLNNDRLRLSDLQNKLPDINQRMLIRQLRELEQDKIIEKTIYPVVPPKVDYKLTEIGLKLDKVVFSICNWGDSFLDKVRRDT